jgi:hypothetical protein
LLLLTDAAAGILVDPDILFLEGLCLLLRQLQLLRLLVALSYLGRWLLLVPPCSSSTAATCADPYR